VSTESKMESRGPSSLCASLARRVKQGNCQLLQMAYQLWLAQKYCTVPDQSRVVKPLTTLRSGGRLSKQRSQLEVRMNCAKPRTSHCPNSAVLAAGSVSTKSHLNDFEIQYVASNEEGWRSYAIGTRCSRMASLRRSELLCMPKPSMILYLWKATVLSVRFNR
jgi:hypothetical protein